MPEALPLRTLSLMQYAASVRIQPSASRKEQLYDTFLGFDRGPLVTDIPRLGASSRQTYRLATQKARAEMAGVDPKMGQSILPYKQQASSR